MKIAGNFSTDSGRTSEQDDLACKLKRVFFTSVSDIVKHFNPRHCISHLNFLISSSHASSFVLDNTTTYISSVEFQFLCHLIISVDLGPESR